MDVGPDWGASPTVTRTRRGDDERLQALWLEYHRTGDARLREQLVIALGGLVRSIAYRKIREVPPWCDLQDLMACAYEALLKAIDRYDPDRGATLWQYAWTRIHGAMIDELRRGDWAPRALRSQEREIHRARVRLTSRDGRPPSPDELAAAIGITVRELAARQRDITRSVVVSLNDLVVDDDHTPIERIDTVPGVDRTCDPEFRAVRDSAIHSLRQAIAGLAPRDRAVAELLYRLDLNQRETGALLGVTEGRVSQINARLKRTLRTTLAADEPMFAEVASV